MVYLFPQMRSLIVFHKVVFFDVFLFITRNSANRVLRNSYLWVFADEIKVFLCVNSVNNCHLNLYRFVARVRDFEG